jgi:hypothetical protein
MNKDIDTVAIGASVLMVALSIASLAFVLTGCVSYNRGEITSPNKYKTMEGGQWAR